MSNAKSIAIVSVMLLVSLFAGAALVRSESKSSATTQGFIGTAPDATTIEAPAPTF